MFPDRFAWGVNIDNVWTYAGLPQPKSLLLPYVLSMRLPRGPVEILEQNNKAIREQVLQPSEEETPNDTEKLCTDLVIRLKEAKINFTRVWFPWNFFNKKVNDPTEFVMNTFVRILRSEGIEIIAVIGNGYKRFIPQDASVEHTDKYLHQLIPSCTEIVRHYKDSIKIWQIENEPNWWKEHVAVDWRGGLIWLEPNNDERIIKSLHDVVRTECPDGKIIINVEADRNDIPYERYTKYCDILGLDLYPGYAHSNVTSADKIKIASAVKTETGKQVIISETGQPSGPHFLGYSEEKQAEYIRSACETAHTCDAVSALCVWRFSDSYWRSFPMQENHFGLLTKERKPKLAWNEYANQIRDRS